MEEGKRYIAKNATDCASRICGVLRAMWQRLSVPFGIIIPLVFGCSRAIKTSSIAVYGYLHIYINML
jgi:hypothetical protein